MKTKHISILCLAGAALLFGSTAAAIIPSISPVTDETGDVMEDSVVDEAPTAVDDGIGMAVPFPANLPASNLVSSLHSVIGVQTYVRDETTGTRDLRFVVAIENYEGLKEAHFTRTVSKLDGTVLKEEASYEIDTLYESLYSSSGIKWSTALDSSTDYMYAIYTLRGIPEESAYDSVVELTFSGTNTDGTTVSASQSANLAGVLGSVGGKNVAVAYDSDAGTYYAYNNSSYRGSTEAVVPATGVAIKEGTTYVGEPGGAVTELRAISNTGTFEQYTAMTSVTLPDTITTFGNYAFYRCNSLLTLPLPRDLTTIASSSPISFSTSSALTTVNWDAKNLTTIGDTIDKNVDVVNISADVEKLPQTRLFGSSYNPLRVNYAGTTAEWNALLEVSKGTDAEYTGGLDIDNVWCSDTTEVSVTYHLGAATITYDGESRTGDYTLSLISGKTAINIGNPSLEGQYFFGWSTSAEGTESDLYDFSTAVTADLDLYPVWGAAPAGTSFSDPLELTGAVEETTISTTAEYPFYYIKLTPEVAGTYYVHIDNLLDASGAASDGYIVVYNESQVEQSYGNWISNPFTSIVGSTNSTYSDDSRFVRIVAEAGDVYYLGLAADGTYSSSTTTALAGTLTYSITMSNGSDTIAGAAALVKNGEASVFEATSSNVRYFKYEPETSGDVYLSATHNVSFYYSIYSYDPTAENPTYTSVKSSSNVGSSTSLGYVFSATAGLIYYIAAYSYSDVPGTGSTANNLSFSISDVPAGMSISNPAEIPDSGTSLSISAAQLAYYYSYTPTTSGTYSFKMAGSSTSYALTIALYDANGDLLAQSTATSSSSGWSSSYATSLELFYDLEASTQYIIMVGYTSASSYSSMSATFTYGYVAAGSRIEAAIDSTWADSSLTVEANSTAATYYKWTETEAGAGTFTLSATSDDSGAAITIQTLSSSGSTTTVLSLTSGNSIKFAPVAGTTYYIEATSTAATANITLTKGTYVAPLDGYDFADGTTAFRGANEGGSTVYSLVIGGDTFSWGTSSYEVGTVSTDDNGNVVITQNGGYGNRTIYVKGQEAWVNAYTSDFYFMSQRCTGDITSEDAEYVATSDFSKTAGTAIQSLVIDDGTRLYAAMIDGIVYIDCTVTFISGTSIEGGTFTLSYGDTVLGTYDGNSSNVLVANNTSAIAGDFAALGTNGTMIILNIGTDVVTVETEDDSSYSFSYASKVDDTYTFEGTVGSTAAKLLIVDNDTTFTATIVDEAGALVSLGNAAETLPVTGLHYLVATTENASTSITNDSNYPWTIDEEAGTYTAPSGNNSTTTWLIISNTSDSDISITFSYDISSESRYDGMVVATATTGDSSVDYVSGFSSMTANVNSGTATGTMTVEVAAGCDLRIGFKKDGSSSSGRDNIIISGISATTTTYSCGDLVKGA